MKYMIMGATGILAGIMLFGMTWIAAAIYATRAGGYGRFAESISMIGYLPIFISIILVLTGICYFIVAFNKHLEDR